MEASFINDVYPPFNPCYQPNPELCYYTENYKEFPIMIADNLPFFHPAYYKYAIIKTIGKIVAMAMHNAHEISNEFLSRLANGHRDLKQYEDALQQGLIRPVANSMQPVMNLKTFEQQLCFTLIEVCNSTLHQVPTEQLASVVNILIDDNITACLEYIAATSCKEAFVMIQDSVRGTIFKLDQYYSKQSAKVLYGSYLSPHSPSDLSTPLFFSQSSPNYPDVKNVPPGHSIRPF